MCREHMALEATLLRCARDAPTLEADSLHGEDDQEDDQDVEEDACPRRVPIPAATWSVKSQRDLASRCWPPWVSKTQLPLQEEYLVSA